VNPAGPPKRLGTKVKPSGSGDLRPTPVAAPSRQAGELFVHIRGEGQLFTTPSQATKGGVAVCRARQPLPGGLPKQMSVAPPGQLTTASQPPT